MAEERRNGSGATSELKRVLTFKDLLFTCVGGIIGSGIMSIMGITIGMTGRSVPISMFFAAVFVLLGITPIIIITGTVRIRGGQYTIVGMLAGKRMSGLFIIIDVATNISLSMYALSFADYFLAFFPDVPRRLVAAAVLTFFWILNMLGIDKMAKLQNLIVFVLMLALALFAVYGLPNVSPDYLTEDFAPNGFTGMITAAALLYFATSGGQLIAGLSGEAKNPTRDIPRAIIISTFSVAVLYAVVAVVAAGVLPVDQVANKPLTDVARTVLPTPLYVFFMVGGAMFAIVSTLNAQLACAPKALLQACSDGWFPKKMAYIHPKYKTPMVLLTFYYLVGMLPIIFGFDIGLVANLTVCLSQINFIIISWNLVKLPGLIPELWEKSSFRMSPGALKIWSRVAVCVGFIQLWLLARDLSVPMLIGNVCYFIFALIFSKVRSKSPDINIEVSYEAN